MATVIKAPKRLLLKAMMPDVKVVAAGTWSSVFGKEDLTLEDVSGHKHQQPSLNHPLDSQGNSLAQSSTSSIDTALYPGGPGMGMGMGMGPEVGMGMGSGSGAGSQALVMPFIPVISPVLSACHAAEVMGRRAQRFNR